MSNKSIGICKCCNDEYCYECSTHESRADFCSEECQREFDEEIDGETSKE